MGEAAAARAAAAAKASAAAEKARTRMIQVMSFAGATAGTNPAAEFGPGLQPVKKFTAEDGKELVRKAVGRRRAQLETVYREEMLTAWAEELDGLWMWESVVRDEKPYELYGRYMWTEMFPRIPYDQERYNTIRDLAKAQVEGALADFDA